VTLPPEDRTAIVELISLHGHVFDDGDLDRLDIVVTEREDGTVGIRSKGIGVHADGSVSTVAYEDTVVATEAGWRIYNRRVVPRRVPLNGRRT
jgi:hypothetical protein